jgi:hypothetical protein
MTINTWRTNENADGSGWDPIAGTWVNTTARRFGKTTNPQHAATKFYSVDIPQGAIIVSAHIVLESYTGTSNSGTVVNIIIKGEAVDTAVIAASLDDLASAERTIASVEWNNVEPFPSAYGQHTTPLITDIIQEIIDQPGWQSGNDLRIFYEDNGSSTAASRYAYVGGAGVNEHRPRLVVEWEPPPPPTLNAYTYFF